MLDRFSNKFIQFWPHFGALNRSKSITNRPLSKKYWKNEKPSKNTVFTMVFEGLGLQDLLKFEDFQSKYALQNRSRSQLICFTRFLTFLNHFWSHFRVDLGPFWSLGGSLGYFWETLGIVWLQLGGLGCSLVALGSHFSPRNRFLIDCWSIWTTQLDKNRQNWSSKF